MAKDTLEVPNWDELGSDDMSPSERAECQELVRIRKDKDLQALPRVLLSMQSPSANTAKLSAITQACQCSLTVVTRFIDVRFRRPTRHYPGDGNHVCYSPVN